MGTPPIRIAIVIGNDKGEAWGPSKMNKVKSFRDYPYKISYFARKHRISEELAERILDRSQGSKDLANAEASRCKKVNQRPFRGSLSIDLH